MARKDALLRLHERLVRKREALRRKLREETSLSVRAHTGSGDIGDAASDGAQRELDSQLVSLESRELAQVERAIKMIREGRYGLCEVCESRIPVVRLKALPFTPLCVNCQRQHEEFGGDSFNLDADWESACEHEGRVNDRELTLGDIDIR